MKNTTEFACLSNVNLAKADQGAAVVDVPSNFGNGVLDSSFGGNKAIDGNPASQWSSNGDGDNAFIVLQWDHAISVAGVGVWSRDMMTSSAILSFRIQLSLSTYVHDVSYLGPFELLSTSTMHMFDLTDEIATSPAARVQFDRVGLFVETSTRGNTGLRSLEVYGLSHLCAQGNDDSDIHPP